MSFLLARLDRAVTSMVVGVATVADWVFTRRLACIDPELAREALVDREAEDEVLPPEWQERLLDLPLSADFQDCGDCTCTPSSSLGLPVVPPTRGDGSAPADNPPPAGADQPSGPGGCTAALIVRGQHFWCDEKFPHDGWPHGSVAAETIWGHSDESYPK